MVTTGACEKSQDLKLLEATGFENGVVLLRYEIRNRRRIRTFEEPDAGDAARLGVARRPLF